MTLADRNRKIWTWKCNHEKCTAHGIMATRYDSAMVNARSHVSSVHGYGSDIRPDIVLAEEVVVKSIQNKLKAYVWNCKKCGAHGTKTNKLSYVANKGRRHMITKHGVYEDSEVIEIPNMPRDHRFTKKEVIEIFGKPVEKKYDIKGMGDKTCVECGNKMNAAYFKLPLCKDCRDKRQERALAGQSPLAAVTTN